MEFEVLEILTKEKSMEEFLRGVLPRVLPGGSELDVNCFIRSHEGKSHLQKSIPRKFKAYPSFGYPVLVLIIQDQDSNDCMELKRELIGLAQNGGAIPFLVRIACRELENWFLGDLDAIVATFGRGNLKNYHAKRFSGDVDRLSGAEELGKLVGQFSKTQTARTISRLIDLDSNRSKSFMQFLLGLRKLLENN